MSLYNPDSLKKFLEDYFGDQTLSSLEANVSFEVFELKKREVIILENETRIVDMLMMELAFPPYYSYYEFQGGFFIPTSYISFIPQKFPKDAVIISFDPALTYPYPKNTVEILLKTSYSRTLKNYRLLTEGFNTIEPQKQLKDYFNMSAFLMVKIKLIIFWRQKYEAFYCIFFNAHINKFDHLFCTNKCKSR